MLTRMTNALGPLVQWQSEMNRLMEHFFEDLPGPRPYAQSYPAMNVWEDGDAAYIECELPGLTMNDIEVLVTGREVMVKGSRNAQAPTASADNHGRVSWYRRERAAGEFARSVTLPWEIADDKVKATFRDGVLTIELPKAESAKPKKVKVLAK
jgi:HSP20 family protein